MSKDIKICGGNVEIWDQTIGCPECGQELWNYPGMKELGITTQEYEDRFYLMHPFILEDAHDPGDEDKIKDAGPIGGYTTSYNRDNFGNAIEKWI